VRRTPRKIKLNLEQLNKKQNNFFIKIKKDLHNHRTSPFLPLLIIRIKN
jgi:hypothetical protein